MYHVYIYIIFGCVLEVWLFVVGRSAGVFGMHCEWYFLAVGKGLYFYSNYNIGYIRLQGWFSWL